MPLDRLLGFGRHFLSFLKFGLDLRTVVSDGRQGRHLYGNQRVLELGALFGHLGCGLIGLSSCLYVCITAGRNLDRHPTGIGEGRLDHHVPTLCDDSANRRIEHHHPGRLIGRCGVDCRLGR